MARSRYKYICIKEDDTMEIVASQDIYKILDECDDWNNPYSSIIRQELYDSKWDNCKVTSWSD